MTTYHPRARLRRAALAASAAGLFALTTACATGPTTRQEVCAKYDELGGRLTGVAGVIGNPVFWAAGDLADVADRYEGPEDLSSDAELLDEISDADETDTEELSNATQNIADLCGHPLGLGTTTP